ARVFAASRAAVDRIALARRHRDRRGSTGKILRRYFRNPKARGAGPAPPTQDRGPENPMNDSFKRVLFALCVLLYGRVASAEGENEVNLLVGGQKVIPATGVASFS